MNSGNPPSNDMTPAERFSAALALIPEISEVEAIIRDSFRSDVGPMREIPEYLLSLGGKRIRPAITLLCAKAIYASANQTDRSLPLSSEILSVAAGIELIHMATLMHDDIIDQSPVRRHRESPYAKFGTPLTLLSGDFLLTRAFGLCARLDDTIIAATEQACIELVEGEALETPLYVDQHTLESSLTIAHRKTASLFRLAAFSAGHLSGASNESLRAFSEFGESLGVAFQIIDDVLDVTSSEEVLGKQPGLDIIERKPSIVNVLWLASGDPMAERLKERPITGGEIEYAQNSLQLLKSSPYLEQAKTLARSYSARSIEALSRAIPAQQTRQKRATQALYAVIDFALERLK